MTDFIHVLNHPDGGRVLRCLRERDGRQEVLNLRTLEWEDGAEEGVAFTITPDQQVRVGAPEAESREAKLVRVATSANYFGWKRPDTEGQG